MDKHSYVLASLVVLCALPLYCDLRSVSDRLSFDAMDGISDSDDIVQSKKRHRVAYDQVVSALKLPEQRSQEQKQNRPDEKLDRKNVKRNVKSRRRRSNVKRRKVVSRSRELKTSQRFIRKLKAALVKLEEMNTASNESVARGNLSEDHRKDPERRVAVSEDRVDAEETKGVTFSRVTEEYTKPDRQKIRIKIGDFEKEYDEAEYCESIFLPKEPPDLETVFDERENEIDDTEDTQSKIKRDYDDDVYGALALKQILSKVWEDQTEETLGNVKRDYNKSRYKGNGRKDDNCVDKDGSINKINHLHSVKVTKKPLKVLSKNKMYQNINTRLVTLRNFRKSRRIQN